MNNFGKRGWALLLLCAVGLRLKFLDWGYLHFDELFQYLEPAYGHLTGAQHGTWEFRVGARSWLLPSFYGAFIALGQSLGLKGVTLQLGLKAHNALLSLLLLPAMAQMARLLAPNLPQARLLAALWATAFAPLVVFCVSTLSELPALVAYTLATVCSLSLSLSSKTAPPPTSTEDGGTKRAQQQQRRLWAMGLGCGLGTAFVCRYTLLAAAVWPLAVIFVQPRLWWALGWMGLGASLPLLLLMGTDAATWGSPWASITAYVRFNWLLGGAQAFGILPWHYYLDTQLGSSLGLGRWLLVVPALWAWRHTWRLLLPATLNLVLFSCTGHKEERFLLHIWPLWLVAGSIGLCLATKAGLKALSAPGRRLWPTALWPQLRGQIASWAEALVLGLAALACLVSSARHMQLPRHDAGVGHAIAWLGAQPDLYGIGFDSFGSSYLLLGRGVPFVGLNADTRANVGINYLLAKRLDSVLCLWRRSDFELVYHNCEVAVFRRRALSIGDFDASKWPAACQSEADVGEILAALGWPKSKVVPGWLHPDDD